ncbi:MAG: phospholipase [Chlorobi bacterium]|nr:phospholipase [Chlorobiota bacterium]
MIKKPQNVALVLSGGGSRGMAHIGVIEEILKHKHKITSVAGTSIGSVVGGVYAAGKLGEYKNWVSGLGKMDIFRLMDFAITKSGFIKGEKIFSELEKMLGPVNIEDLAIPFATVAVAINLHKEIVFTSGPLRKAVRASVAVPTILTPVQYKGMELVDGGVLNPLPLNLVKRNKKDLLIAVDLNADIKYTKPRNVRIAKKEQSNYLALWEQVNKRWTHFFSKEKNPKAGYFDLLTKSIYAMQARLTETSIKKYKPDILVQISRDSCDLFEFHRATEMIEYGRRQARKALLQ